MTKRTHSLKFQMMFQWTIFASAIALVFVLYGIQFMGKMQQELKGNVDSLAKNYSMQFSRDLQSLKQSVDKVYADSEVFRKVSMSTLDDYDWIDVVFRMEDVFDTKSASLDFMGGMFYFDEERGSMRSSYSNYPFNGTERELNYTLSALLPVKCRTGKNTFIFADSEEDYLCYTLMTKHHYVGIVINLNRYFQTSEDVAVFLGFRNRLYSLNNDNFISSQDIEVYTNTIDAFADRNSYMLSYEDISEPDFSLYVLRNENGFNHILQTSEFWIIIILIPLLVILGLYIFGRQTRLILLAPVDHLMKRVSILQRESEELNGDNVETLAAARQADSAELPIETIEEFIEINQQIDAMLDRIEELNKEKYVVENRANAAELQYYQLQVNPHFFLNCLNTISSLLEANQTMAANDLIMSLSAHFRYVFRDNRSLKLLSDEIKETKDYCEIYSIKGGTPIFFSDEISEAAAYFHVPILCVQTFAENAIKYVAKKGKMLSIRVHADVQETDEGRKLVLAISDNGPGYSEENLQVLNKPIDRRGYVSEHAGIYNLRSRLQLIYGDRASIYFYNAPYGGAAIEIVIPEDENEHTDN